jgi:excisionase family DNA binding protein
MTDVSRTRQAGLEPTTLGLEGHPKNVQTFALASKASFSLKAHRGPQSSDSLGIGVFRKRFVPVVSPNLRALIGDVEYLLRVRDVANRLGVCTATVYALCDRGELRHIRISNAIRIAPADLEEFLDRKRGRPQ